MLSQYLVLNRLHLMDTTWAVNVPGVFSTYSGFLMYRFFCRIPEELLEAARIDGAGEWKIFWAIGVPLALFCGDIVNIPVSVVQIFCPVIDFFQKIM